MPKLIAKTEAYHCEDTKLNFTDARLAAFMKALIVTNGRLSHTFAFGHEKRDNWVGVVVLPEGAREKFEEIAGVELTEPEIIGGSNAT